VVPSSVPIITANPYWIRLRVFFPRSEWLEKARTSTIVAFENFSKSKKYRMLEEHKQIFLVLYKQ
jgi:hypothetical protein